MPQLTDHQTRIIIADYRQMADALDRLAAMYDADPAGRELRDARKRAARYRAEAKYLEDMLRPEAVAA